MTEIPSLVQLLEAGVHFGHQESKWHPKMAPYIFGTRNDVHIIDLDKTRTKLREALDYVRDTVARGGVILFLGSKRQAKDIIKKYAEECGMPYISNRWLGGTLTNFSEIQRLVKRYNDLRSQLTSGALAKYTKKEQAGFAKQIEEMETKVGGMQSVTRPPDAIFIVDLKKEKTALLEAIEKHMPTIALVDSNVNPEDVTYPIPSNDDAVKTIELMVSLVASAVNDGKVIREARVLEMQKAEVVKPPVGE